MHVAALSRRGQVHSYRYFHKKQIPQRCIPLTENASTLLKDLIKGQILLSLNSMAELLLAQWQQNQTLNYVFENKI